MVELKSDFPDLDVQLREVFTARANQVPTPCGDHHDATRALIGGGGDRAAMTNGATGPGQETESNSENTSGIGELTADGGNIRFDLDDVLDCLGWADGEFTAVCHQPIGGAFTSSVVESVSVSARVKSLPEEACTWFSVNPTAGPERHNQGRGREREVSRWAAFYLDVDVKVGAFPDLDKAAEYIRVLSGMVGSQPVGDDLLRPRPSAAVADRRRRTGYRREMEPGLPTQPPVWTSGYQGGQRLRGWTG